MNIKIIHFHQLELRLCFSKSRYSKPVRINWMTLHSNSCWNHLFHISFGYIRIFRCVLIVVPFQESHLISHTSVLCSIHHGPNHLLFISDKHRMDHGYRINTIGTYYVFCWIFSIFTDKEIEWPTKNSNPFWFRRRSKMNEKNNHNNNNSNLNSWMSAENLIKSTSVVRLHVLIAFVFIFF